MKRKNTPASAMAFSSVMAALAVVIMSLGGLIPVATYACPVICMIILSLVKSTCGIRLAWAWYGAVCVLSLLLSPDKEAGFVFLFLGNYSILKPKMDSLPLPFVWKGLYFNSCIIALYWLLMKLLGMDYLADEFMEFGWWGLALMLVMGNLVFFLTDRLLTMRLGGR